MGGREDPGAKMTHWRGLIEREYLGAWDLVDKAGKPKEWTLAIESATSRKVYSQKIKKDAGRCVLSSAARRNR